MKMQEHVKNLLEDLLSSLALEKFEVTIQEPADGTFLIHIDSEDSPLLIGKHGSGIDALQQIMYLLLRNTIDAEMLVPRIRIDIGNYKENYEKDLLEMIDKKIEKVQLDDIKETLHPMNSYHRRIVHLYIAEKYPDIQSESLGTESMKKILIKKKTN